MFSLCQTHERKSKQNSCISCKKKKKKKKKSQLLLSSNTHSFQHLQHFCATVIFFLA
jgi:hypothetical protein